MRFIFWDGIYDAIDMLIHNTINLFGYNIERNYLTVHKYRIQHRLFVYLSTSVIFEALCITSNNIFVNPWFWFFSPWIIQTWGRSVYDKSVIFVDEKLHQMYEFLIYKKFLSVLQKSLNAPELEISRDKVGYEFLNVFMQRLITHIILKILHKQFPDLHNAIIYLYFAKNGRWIWNGDCIYDKTDSGLSRRALNDGAQKRIICEAIRTNNWTEDILTPAMMAFLTHKTLPSLKWWMNEYLLFSSALTFSFISPFLYLMYIFITYDVLISISGSGVTLLTYVLSDNPYLRIFIPILYTTLLSHIPDLLK